MFEPEKVALRPNVPEDQAEKAREELAGYYAHMVALDDCIARLLGTLEDCGIEEDTVFVFTSDHGDMLHSHGMTKKQQPYAESIMVPFLLRYPRAFGSRGRELDTLINTPDIAPTLLGLCGVPVPETAGHLDLLHAARRVYRGVLPDCRLETLERYVCQRRRTEDIAGHLIPEAYHHFVRTGNAIDLGRIISHNAWDLVTLLDLMLRLAGKTRQRPKG